MNRLAWGEDRTAPNAPQKALEVYKVYTAGSSHACAFWRVEPSMKKHVWRALIEVAFIIFLFYANRLMREFERSGMGRKNGWTWALADVLTTSNFEIALIAALIGYVFFEFLRKKF
jgi:dolichol kinase